MKHREIKSPYCIQLKNLVRGISSNIVVKNVHPTDPSDRSIQYPTCTN